MKSLPGPADARRSVSSGRRRRAEEDLGLQRIGVLELVDEDARELLLQVRAHLRVRPDQIARARQQVGEVEGAGRLLQPPDSARRAGQLLLQAARKIGVGVLAELLQVGEQSVARREHFGAGRGHAELVAAAFAGSREAAIARQIDEPRFPAVEIAAAKRLFQRDLAAQPAHAIGVDVEIVARR